MAMAMCLGCRIKCSTDTHPGHFGVQKVKTALSSAVKPVIRELENSALKTDVSKAFKNASLMVVNTIVDSVFQFVDQPQLPSQKNFAPVEEIGELVEIDCCEGQIPVDFPEGIYIRNGANPLFGGLKSSISLFGKTDSVWIEGEGMLHALYFTKDAGGNWCLKYKNRFVETDTYRIESQRKKPAFIPTVQGDPPAILAASFLNMLRFGQATKMFSNTNVFEHGGKYYSTAENYLPQEIDLISLETHGNWNLNGAWTRPFTSHPKKVPGTGELVTVGFDAQKPYCIVGVISADGKELIHELDLQLDCGTFFHEVGVSEKYNILIDHMLTIDAERVAKGGQLIEYDAEKDARIAVFPRYGGVDSIKWFFIEPSCTFHLINSFEEGDEVVVRGCKASTGIIPGPGWGEDKFDWFSRGFRFHPVDSDTNNAKGRSQVKEGMLFTCVTEWRLNMKTSEVKEREISGTEFSMDFPMINAEFTGLKHKYGYTQIIDSVASSASGKTKYGGLAKLYFEEAAMEQDKYGEKVKMEYHWLPKNNYCTGSAFIAKEGAIEEDDGWIVTFAHDEDSDVSYVLVVDAKNFAGEPIAKISLPQRVPYGHHGSFFNLSKQQIDTITRS